MNASTYLPAMHRTRTSRFRRWRIRILDWACSLTLPGAALPTA